MAEGTALTSNPNPAISSHIMDQTCCVMMVIVFKGGAYYKTTCARNHKEVFGNTKVL